MDDLGSRIKHVSNELKHYVEARLELSVINISEQVAYWIGKAIQNLFGYTILALGLVFGLTALAIYLGELLDEEWAGYLIVASPFLIVGLILVLTKPTLIAGKIQQDILSELLSSFDKKDKQKEVKKLTAPASSETLNQKTTSGHGE
ncbi:phage holin family protein [Gracilimonas tropica]|uniref:phage holin family protein n=1 Tax=Gracilimonas tropica TaxID=454600 RepID=UPI00037C1CD5|nr:phage holin family protein [Gracilimonas tropica]